jgi:hypothetical protein
LKTKRLKRRILNGAPFVCWALVILPIARHLLITQRALTPQVLRCLDLRMAIAVHLLVQPEREGSDSATLTD